MQMAEDFSWSGGKIKVKKIFQKIGKKFKRFRFVLWAVLLCCGVYLFWFCFVPKYQFFVRLDTFYRGNTITGTIEQIRPSRSKDRPSRLIQFNEYERIGVK